MRYRELDIFKILGFVWGFFGKSFGIILKVFGFFKIILGIFYGGFFFLWGVFFVYIGIDFFVEILVFVKILSKWRRKEEKI